MVVSNLGRGSPRLRETSPSSCPENKPKRQEWLKELKKSGNAAEREALRASWPEGRRAAAQLADGEAPREAQREHREPQRGAQREAEREPHRGSQRAQDHRQQTNGLTQTPPHPRSQARPQSQPRPQPQLRAQAQPKKGGKKAKSGPSSTPPPQDRPRGPGAPSATAFNILPLGYFNPLLAGSAGGATYGSNGNSDRGPNGSAKRKQGPDMDASHQQPRKQSWHASHR